MVLKAAKPVFRQRDFSTGAVLTTLLDALLANAGASGKKLPELMQAWGGDAVKSSTFRAEMCALAEVRAAMQRIVEDAAREGVKRKKAALIQVHPGVCPMLCVCCVWRWLHAIAA